MGITKKIAENLFKLGINVITSGNHIWHYKEILDYIDNENRLLRPANMSNNLLYRTLIYKFKNMKICVINLMTNVYMPKCNNVFQAAKCP